MAYKSMNDRGRRDALPDFLRAADQLPGLVCTIIVDKSYKWMSSSPTVLKAVTDRVQLQGSWGAPAFEMMARVVLLWSVILGRVSQKDQSVAWVTDEDDIVANEGRLADFLTFASRFSGMFVSGQMNRLDVNTTAVDQGDCQFEDVVSIPDLCAGALCEVANNWVVRGETPARRTFEWDQSNNKAKFLSDWYFARPERLRRLAILVAAEPDGHASVQKILPQAD